MNEAAPAYGLWGLVLINSVIFIMVAFTFFKPETARDWRSFGAFSAFLVAKRRETGRVQLLISGRWFDPNRARQSRRKLGRNLLVRHNGLCARGARCGEELGRPESVDSGDGRRGFDPRMARGFRAGYFTPKIEAAFPGTHG